jgi:FkbM family methyltransferase
MAKSCAIDMGANIGNHSLYFSDYFLKVLSFEPNPRTFKVLALNAELASNIECFNFGLSDRDRSARMNVDRANIGSSSITDCGGQQIDLKRLDDVIGNEKVWLIKIDVEGHEIEAISGSTKTIKANKPVILFEQHPQEISNGTSATIEFLKKLGYSKFAIMERTPSGSPIVKALAKMVKKSSNRLKIVNRFEPDFFPLILALPDWAQLA